MSARIPRPRSFRLSLSLYYAALFMLFGLQIPYFPVWLNWRGLTPAEIGIVSAAPLFVRVLVGPAAAFIADRSGDHRRAVVIASGCALAAVVALSQVHGLTLVLLCTTVFLAGAQTGGPIGDAIALAGVRERGVDYGRMRLWGSLTFIGATFAGGAVVGRFGAPSVMWMLAASSGALLLAAWLLPAPSAAAGEGGRAGRGVTASQVMAVASSGSFLLFLLAAGVVQASHAVFYIFGVLHWQSQGISTTAIGVLWAISVAAEVALFATATRHLQSVGPLGLILAGAAAAVLRWGCMALDPPLALLLPIQLLHALTFGATHLGAMHYIASTVPREQAGTAQAILAAASGGVGMGAATLLAGALYGPYAGLSYLSMAAIAALGLCAGLALRARQAR